MKPLNNIPMNNSQSPIAAIIEIGLVTLAYFFDIIQLPPDWQGKLLLALIIGVFTYTGSVLAKWVHKMIKQLLNKK